MATTLRSFPSVAERIGYFFAEFSGLEWDLRWAFDHLFSFRRELSEAFFRPREGTSSRIDSMFRFASALAPESAISLCFEEIEPRVKRLVRFRNVLAHGTMGGSGEGGALVTLEKTQYNLTDKLLDEQLAEMEDIKRLLNLAWHAPRGDNFPQLPKG